MSRRCTVCGTEYPDEVAFCGHDGAINVQVQRPGDPADRRLGQRVGDHVLVARVADGAMGRVYEARQVHTRARVAIKVLHDDVASDRVAVERFKREYETAASLDSRFVVRVLDFGALPAAAASPGSAVPPGAAVGASKDSWFMTMEYLVGQELGGLLRASKAMEPARALRVLCQVGLGLDDAHGFGVIHRDLKPDNVFLCEGPEGDEVRLLDFGSVKLQMETGPKLTAFGTTLGSPVYMSPEQAMGRQDVDHRSDGFAVASILYEMLSGEVAFGAGSIAEILMRIVNEMPIPLSVRAPGVPQGLDDVLEKALAKDKKARHGSVIEFVRAVLEAFGLPVAPGRAGIEVWARTAVPEWRQALAESTPPAPRPFGAPPVPQAATGAAPPARAAAAPQADAFDVAPVGQASMKPWVLGAAVMAAVAVLGLGALALLAR